MTICSDNHSQMCRSKWACQKHARCFKSTCFGAIDIFKSMSTVWQWYAKVIFLIVCPMRLFGKIQMSVSSCDILWLQRVKNKLTDVYVWSMRIITAQEAEAEPCSFGVFMLDCRRENATFNQTIIAAIMNDTASIWEQCSAQCQILFVCQGWTLDNGKCSTFVSVRDITSEDFVDSVTSHYGFSS